MLSKEAQEVIDITEALVRRPLAEKYVAESPGGNYKYVPVDNIINEHAGYTEVGYKAFINEVRLIVNGVLISNTGGNSEVYYELKNAGYPLKVAESYSFGPLVCGIKYQKLIGGFFTDSC